jgi:hypothetical protein
MVWDSKLWHHHNMRLEFWVRWKLLLLRQMLLRVHLALLVLQKVLLLLLQLLVLYLMSLLPLLLFSLLLQVFFCFLYSLLLPYIEDKADFFQPQRLFARDVGLFSSLLKKLVASTLTLHPLAKLGICLWYQCVSCIYGGSGLG